MKNTIKHLLSLDWLEKRSWIVTELIDFHEKYGSTPCNVEFYVWQNMSSLPNCGYLLVT